MSRYKLTGKESLGVEFGSTRIKAVLVDEECNPVASGSYTWENQSVNGISRRYGRACRQPMPSFTWKCLKRRASTSPIFRPSAFRQ